MTQPSASLENRSSAEAQVLILSDGKPGHLHQSIAFARLLNCGYQVRQVAFRNRLGKLLSYLFDRLGWRPAGLFEIDAQPPRARLVVSAGSGTYYANRVIAQQLGARSIALMWPAGYRADFDLIMAQQHDNPPQRDNLTELPVNLSFPVPNNLVPPGTNNSPCIAVIVGGPSKSFRINPQRFEQQLKEIFQMFPDGDFLVTTSRRTPREIEAIIETFPFRYRLLYSRCQDNPLGDFIAQADYLFITEDSTSMVSEAVCWGKGSVEILPLEQISAGNKISRMMDSLAGMGCLHRFDGSLGKQQRKIELDRALQAAVPQAWYDTAGKQGKGSED